MKILELSKLFIDFNMNELIATSLLDDFEQYLWQPKKETNER